MTRRRLPIGIQTLRKIREEGCYYVDKTAHVRRLVDEGSHYFLSRPRRFGKSLLVDTLKELFEGNEPLFEGLAIHDGWDWSVQPSGVAPELRRRHCSGGIRATCTRTMMDAVATMADRAASYRCGVRYAVRRRVSAT